MSELLPIGTYRGKLVGYNIRPTEKGDAEPQCRFKLENGKDVYWRGSWNGGAAETTMKALLTMGMKNENQFPLLHDGPISGALDLSKDYDLVIEHKESIKKPGEFVEAVRWVNEVYENKWKDAMPKEEYLRQIKDRNLGAILQKVADSMKIKLDDKKTPVPKASDEHIPF